MKKKVVTTLLSAMLCVSMVPMPVMAFEEDAESFEVTADDFGAGQAEQTTEDASEDVSDIEITDEDTEDAAESDVDVIEEESAEETGTEGETPSAPEDETALFSDDAQAGTVTLNGTVFEIGKTYIVPLTLKNAHNLEQDSAAVACPGKFGTLTFDTDGTPKLSTNLRSVTVGTLTDYAYNFKIYQSGKPSGETVDAEIVAVQTVQKADGSGNHEVPETISFAIPKETFDATGVYLSMYVDAMGYAPDAYLQIDYAGAKESGDPSLNYTTEVSTAEVEQFGNYNVTSQVTVTDGRITDIVLSGNDFKGTHAQDNKNYLNTAINGSFDESGMKSRLIGLYMNDAKKLNDLDTVTGATYSSNAIKTATMNALGVKIEQEVIPDAPEETPEPGLYLIDIKDRTDVVDHGLVGESKKVSAYLRVDDNGKMWLTYKMVSGTSGEPLYVLGYNGYYPNNDTTQALSMDGVTYSTEVMEAPTIGENQVVTDITVPLDGVRQTYINNVYLYVEAMKNLDGEVSGVFFDKGKFNINSTITLYWDTLSKFENIDNPVAKLSDGVYKVSGEMVKVNKVDYSMSNNAINHNIRLTVKNGLPYISMNFNGMNVSGLRGYLKNLNYYKTGFTKDKYGNPVGELAPVTIDSYQKYSDGSTFSDDFDSDYPNDITFPLILEASQDGDDCNYIPMQVYVPVMEALSAGSGTQNVYLKLDYSTITKTTADDSDFAEQEQAPSKEQDQTISGTTTFNKKYGDKAFSLGAKAKTKISYKSDKTSVAAVDSKGNVTIKGAGTAKITITAAAGNGYKEAKKTVTVKVARGNQTVSGAKASYTVTLGSKAFSLGAKAPGKLTYKSSNTKVATVDKYGKVIAKGTGTVKITISAASSSNYNAASKTVTVKVNKAAPVIKVKTTSATVKYTNLKKKTQSVALGASVSSKGTLSYQKVSGNKAVTVDKKSGRLSVRKGTKKGTYKVKVRIRAAAKGIYNAGSKDVTVTIRVK